MTTVVERGDRSDASFVRAFADVPRAVRVAPYDRFLPGPSYVAQHFAFATEASAFWLARRGGALVGRVAAFVSPTRPGVGYVGLFESADPESARAPLDAATAFLRARGIERVFGPIDRSTWYSYRFRVDPKPEDTIAGEEDPFSWEPWQPPSYVEAFLAAGFTEAERYYSHAYRGVEGMHLRDKAALVRPAADLAFAQGYRFEPFSADWRANLEDMYALGTECFANNFLYEPPDWKEFESLYAPIGGRVDHRPSCWLVDSVGSKKGFVLAFVDRGYVVMKTIGIVSELRRTGLSIALMWAMCHRGAELGFDHSIAALYKQGNASEKMIREGMARATAWRHEYALFTKPL